MPSSTEKRGKRLIVTCDGTWVNSDNGFVRDSWLPWKTGGRLAISSNVTRICRALKPRSDDGVPQVVYYQGGLGSQNSFWSYLFGGYLGDGISENIREAYAFLANNYEEGDEIILIGFSRGAFTARSIGGLISAIGLLTRQGLGAFYPIFKDWENQGNDSYKPVYGSTTWPLEGRPRFSNPKYVQLLKDRGLTRHSIPIKAIAVWDTVGSLGVPDIKLFGLTVHRSSRAEYAFINTEVAPNVENAYQALALDEKRAPFAPTVWESPAAGSGAALKELKQCWFPGVHSSVGGGYQDSSISDITLAWLMTQLSAHLSFNEDYISIQRQQNEDFYKSKNVPVRTYALGLLQDSAGGLAGNITGTEVRTPGCYHATDPKTGHNTTRKLVNTCEFIHPSVRYRINVPGRGLSKSDTDFVGKGDYIPLALPNDRWTYVAGNKAWGRNEMGLGKDAAKWDSYGKWIGMGQDGKPVFIVEDKIELGSIEEKLLSGWGREIASKVVDDD